MANRRELKKYVNYVTSELFIECLVNKLYVPNTDKEKADKLMAEILNLQNDFINRISHTEPGNDKGYYKKFYSYFNENINHIIEALNNLK